MQIYVLLVGGRAFAMNKDFLLFSGAPIRLFSRLRKAKNF